MVNGWINQTLVTNLVHSAYTGPDCGRANVHVSFEDMARNGLTSAQCLLLCLNSLPALDLWSENPPSKLLQDSSHLKPLCFFSITFQCNWNRWKKLENLFWPTWFFMLPHKRWTLGILQIHALKTTGLTRRSGLGLSNLCSKNNYPKFALAYALRIIPSFSVLSFQVYVSLR